MFISPSQIWFELVFLFVNYIVNFISTELRVCDLYLLNHVILVVKWILPRSFMIFDGLPDLYKWKYVRVNM